MQRKKALTIAATTAIVLGAATAAGATNMGLLGTNRHAPDVGTLTVPTVPTSVTPAAAAALSASVQSTSTHGNDDSPTTVAGTPPASVEPETETESESATTAPSSSSSTTVKSTTESGDDGSSDDSSEHRTSTHPAEHQHDGSSRR